MSQDRLRSPAEQCQKIVDQTSLRGLAGNRRIENMKIADFPDAACGFFPLEAVNGRLDGRVRRPVLLRKGFLDLAYGARAAGPARASGLQFALSQTESVESAVFSTAGSKMCAQIDSLWRPPAVTIDSR